MPTATKKNGWKTCSRGHKYRGAHCQTCWKGGKEPGTKRGKSRHYTR